MEGSKTSWTLCLSAGDPSTRRVVVVEPNKETVAGLYQRASDIFDRNVVELKCGFPPKVLPIGSSLLSDSQDLSNQVRLHVTFEEKPKKAKKQGSLNVEGRPRRAKRAAFEAASESFSEVIKQQDQIMRSERISRKRSNRTSSAGSASGQGRAKNARVKAFAAQGSGRRLGDGAVVKSPVSKVSSAKSSNKHEKKEDVTVALLGALDDSGKMGRILRKGMKNAVQNSYESSKAVARLGAALLRSPTSLSFDKRGDKLLVRFQKGVQGHGSFEENVDWIPPEVLKQVINAIHRSDREALRPHNLAFLSPRVHWTLVFMYMNPREDKKVESIEEALEMVSPDLDWSFLRRRKQTLSAKALENLRQKDEESGDPLDKEDYSAAVDVVSHVEHAMDQLHQYDKAKKARKLAEAAIGRLQQKNESTWAIVTPSETDEDELLECIRAVQVPPVSASLEQLMKGLIEGCNIHNWRELANAQPDQTLTALMKNSEISDLESKTIAGWIECARQETLEEIMVEICDGNLLAVQVLREKARSGTPKDLAAWRSVSDLLFEEVRASLAGETNITASTLHCWCDRAHQSLKQFEWLGWYATPIE